MIKNFRTKSVYKNYRILRRRLEINKNLSKGLIRLTHSTSDTFHYKIYAIEDLIRECEKSFYKKKKAYDYITENIESKTNEVKENIRNIIRTL